MITGLMTAGEFSETRHTMPEGGRWHELHSGRPVLLESPNDEHGTVVLNLSRALAKWFSEQNSKFFGYAAHDVGLLVDTAPDTVLMPPISYFDEGECFGQSDRVIADLVPRLVVDIASSNDRRLLMRERTLMFLNHSVECVWIPDPFKREVQVLQRGVHTVALGDRQTLSGGTLLPGFELSVSALFAQPIWWDQM
ncbi:MAG: Uma2 family endonuclease [Planctomycetaceae bacterium]